MTSRFPPPPSCSGRPDSSSNHQGPALRWLGNSDPSTSTQVSVSQLPGRLLPLADAQEMSSPADSVGLGARAVRCPA
jgi:hypothetical protein